MSDYLAIAAVTATLSDALLSAVKDVIPGTEVKVTTQRPDEPTGPDANLPRVNLYLYQVVPNPTWRNADLPTRRSLELSGPKEGAACKGGALCPRD